MMSDDDMTDMPSRIFNMLPYKRISPVKTGQTHYSDSRATSLFFLLDAAC